VRSSQRASACPRHDAFDQSREFFSFLSRRLIHWVLRPWCSVSAAPTCPHTGQQDLSQASPTGLLVPNMLHSTVHRRSILPAARGSCVLQPAQPKGQPRQRATLAAPPAALPGATLALVLGFLPWTGCSQGGFYDTGDLTRLSAVNQGESHGRNGCSTLLTVHCTVAGVATAQRVAATLGFLALGILCMIFEQ
jgi:hypothetical protein